MIDNNMLNAAAPYCDNTIQSKANQSIVRQALMHYYSTNQAFRGEYIQYACLYAKYLMSQNNTWQNAISAGAEAVASIFIMKIASSDQQVMNAFSQDQQGAHTTRSLANEAQNVVNSALRPVQQPMGYGNMQQMGNTQFGNQMPATPLAGAFVTPNQNVGAQAPNRYAPVGITLPVNNQQAVQSNHTPAKVIEKPQAQIDLMDAQQGLPPLFDMSIYHIEYIKHNGQDYFKETKTMDPNAHNHSPAFFMEQASQAVAKIVSNDPVTGTNGVVKNSSDYKVNNVDNPHYNRVLFNDQNEVYVIADMDDLSAEQTHITHMPTMDMILAADTAKSVSGIEASAVRDSNLVEKIVYGKAEETFTILMNCIETSKNVIEFAGCLAHELQKAINQSHQESSPDQIVRMNTIIKTFVRILNSYIRTASKKPNLPVNVFDEITDIGPLIKWLEKSDNGIYRTLMEETQFTYWINNNFILNQYEGSDNLTIESKKAVVYSTMVFSQLNVSFAEGCDKAVLTEDINQWLYYLFVSHLKSSAGRRLYCPVRYFFRDDVCIDVMLSNAILGNLLIRLVEIN